MKRLLLTLLGLAAVLFLTPACEMHPVSESEGHGDEPAETSH